ncbi:MAG: DNA repair exonuclease [Desulfomicrobium sp.]|nr:DNA repair exonuclease [Desulfomicrobium sp.]
MFSFLHAADIHLDSPLRGLETYDDAPVEQIRTASRRAFDNLVDLALEQEVDFVLLAGDLYDGDWRDYNTGLYFINRMGRLRENNIQAFLVSGNHDAASQITKALHLPGNVYHFSHHRPETRVLESLGVAIHGQSFSSRSVADNLARQYPEAIPGLFNIGLLHTSLTGRTGHASYAPCQLEDLLAKGYGYWALGHVHQREQVHQEPWIIFPGNIQGRHVRETGAKGCTLVQVEAGVVCQVEHVDLDVLRFSLCVVDLTPCTTFDDVRQEIHAGLHQERQSAQGRPVAVRLVLQGVTRLHSTLCIQSHLIHEEVRAMAADWGDVWLEKVVVETALPQEQLFSPALPDLFEAIENLNFDEQTWQEILPEFEALRSKLPAKLMEQDNLFQPQAHDLRHLGQAVRNLLMARLLGEHHEN